MEKKKLERINELARLQKSPCGLTAEQKAEQEALRREYIDEFKSSLKRQLDNIDVEYPSGKTVPLKRKRK